MCSRGSVIPLFIDQIKARLPLTVTDPNMTRFIMSLEEAVELVLFAFENGTSGDILVMKAPACTIGTLAQAVRELFHADNPIQVIGIRHGEKMYETLLTNEECVHAVDMGRFFRVPADTRDLNYDKYVVKGNVERNPADGIQLQQYPPSERGRSEGEVACSAVYPSGAGGVGRKKVIRCFCKRKAALSQPEDRAVSFMAPAFEKISPFPKTEVFRKFQGVKLTRKCHSVSLQ